MSKKNHTWSQELAQKVQENFWYPSSIQTYQHWIDEKENIDFELETKRCIENIKQLKTDYSLICKSIGIIVFLKSIGKISNHPKQVIFCGINLNLVEKFGIILRSLNFPVILLQNPWDPAGKFEDIQQKLKERVNWEFMEGEGDTHSYDTNLILELLK